MSEIDYKTGFCLRQATMWFTSRYHDDQSSLSSWSTLSSRYGHLQSPKKQPQTKDVDSRNTELNTLLHSQSLWLRVHLWSKKRVTSKHVS